MNFFLYNNLHLTFRFVGTLEYKKNYNNRESSFRKLVDLAEEEEDGDEELAERLMDYRTVDKYVYKKFLDLSMPAVAKSNFVQAMVVEDCLGDIVTRGEEAFAFLILENNIQRWCHIAGEKDGPMPVLKYQKTVKKRKDDRNSAGDWTDDGKKRFNKIADDVLNIRNEEGRTRFERKIKELYEDDVKKDARLQRKKRKLMLEKNKKNGVEVTNLFDPGTIDSL